MSNSIHDLIDQITEYNNNLPEHVEQPELPEFHFSPRGPRFLSRAFLCVDCGEPIRERSGQRMHFEVDGRSPVCIDCADAHNLPQQGPMAPPKPYVKGKPVTGLSKDEKTWRQMGTVFDAPVTTHDRPPVGTAPTLEGLQRYLARMDSYEAEWRAIAATQNLELPTVGQELAQTGISSVSLSSSSNDDEDVVYEAPSDYTEELACRYGTAYLTAELADLARRIEWERYIFGCSSSTKIYAKPKEDGSGLKIACDNRTWTADMVRAYKKKIAKLVHGRSVAELENDRARARHYGAVVAAAMTPEQAKSWHSRARRANAYLNVADNNIARMSDVDYRDLVLRADPDEQGATIAAFGEIAEAGPSELGLHWLDIDLEEDGHYEREVRYEPSEFELWPEDALSA